MSLWKRTPGMESSTMTFDFKEEWVTHLLHLDRDRCPVWGSPPAPGGGETSLSTPSLSPTTSSLTTTAASTPHTCASAGRGDFERRQQPICAADWEADREVWIEPALKENPSYTNCQHERPLSVGRGRRFKRASDWTEWGGQLSPKRVRLSSVNNTLSSRGPSRCLSAMSSEGLATEFQRPRRDSLREQVDEDVDHQETEGYGFWEVLEGSREDQFARGVPVPLAPILRIRAMPMLEMPVPRKLVGIDYEKYEMAVDEADGHSLGLAVPESAQHID